MELQQHYAEASRCVRKGVLANLITRLRKRFNIDISRPSIIQ
jgi:uncharacterized protein YlxP (DUF503 family)